MILLIFSLRAQLGVSSMEGSAGCSVWLNTYFSLKIVFLFVSWLSLQINVGRSQNYDKLEWFLFFCVVQLLFDAEFDEEVQMFLLFKFEIVLSFWFACLLIFGIMLEIFLFLVDILVIDIAYGVLCNWTELINIIIWLIFIRLQK